MASRSVSPLLRLPNEILYMIAEKFCSPADIVKLLVCNRQLKDKLTWCLLRQNVKSYGATLVPWAAFNGQLETLKTLHSMDDTLITRRWETDQSDENDVSGMSTPGNPRFAQLRQLPNTRGGEKLNGISALHAAVAAGHDHIISWLLDNGSDIDSKCRRLCRCMVDEGGFDGDWCTPLYLALCQRRDSSARLLIQRGASAPITESSSETSLGSSPAPFSVSSPGSSPGSSSASSSGSPSGSSSGFSPGNYPLESDYAGTTALHTALATGSIELVRLLLDSKLIDPDVTDQHGRTAIFLAIEVFWTGFSPPCTLVRDKLSTARQQLQDPEEHERPEDTALTQLRVLLEAGASLTKASPHPYDDYDHMMILPLHQALFRGAFEAAILMMDAGADVNANSLGYSPLHYIFFHCDATADTPAERMCSRLLAAGADPNPRTSFPWDSSQALDHISINGVTPLMFASQRANLSCISLLLNHGADVNAIDDEGQNAIHWAIQPCGGRVDNSLSTWRENDSSILEEMRATVRLLIQEGCNPRQRSSQQECALELALGSHHDKHYEGCFDSGLVTELLDYGCDKCVNENGLFDPLQIWLTYGFFDCAEELISQGATLTESLVIACCEHYDECVQWFNHDAKLEEPMCRGEHASLIKFKLIAAAFPPYHDGLPYWENMIHLARDHGVLGEQLRSFLNQSTEARSCLAEIEKI